MISTKLYLDARGHAKDEEASLKLSLTMRRKAAYISLGIKIKAQNWNARKMVVINHPEAIYLNNLIARRKIEAEKALYELLESDPELLTCDVIHVKNALAKKLDPVENLRMLNYSVHFIECINKKTNVRTRELYQITLNRLRAFDERFDKRLYREIDKTYLERFDKFLMSKAKKKNARNVHLRNMRAVFNSAIEAGLTECYPFRRYKIENEDTAKRALPLDVLRKLMTEDIDPRKQRYLDVFRLSFYLVGINIVDLCSLLRIDYGRIEYDRAKTGRHYSIEVVPEARAIIDKYKGMRKLLSFSEHYVLYKSLMKKVNKLLKELTGDKRVTMYWGRHSWATYAAELDIPKDTIAAALGHGKKTVTDVYIDYNIKKVDDANRKVIDYILYNKREGV